jgi:PAS domain S-box-containing protein
MRKANLEKEISILFKLALNTNIAGDCHKDAMYFLMLLIEYRICKQAVLYVKSGINDISDKTDWYGEPFMSIPSGQKAPKALNYKQLGIESDEFLQMVDQLDLNGVNEQWLVYNLKKVGVLCLLPADIDRFPIELYDEQIAGVVKKFGEGLLATHTSRELIQTNAKLQECNINNSSVLNVANNELLGKLQHLELAVTGARLGLWEWTIPTGEVKFNETWAELLGYTLEELEPVSIKTWIDFCHPDDLLVSNQLLEKCFKRQIAVYECDLRMLHKNGGWIWVYDQGKVSEWDESGNPVRMSGIHQDINTRKKFESDLLESEDKYRRLVESTLFYIAIIQDGSIVYANKALIDATGLPSGRLMGMLLADLLHPIEKERITELMDQRSEGIEMKLYYEMFFLDIKKQIVNVRMNIQEFTYHHKKAYMCVMEDISVQKRLEQQLFRNQKMEALGILASGIAHDFNNILQIIKTYIDLMELDSGDATSMSNRLQQIDAAINRGGATVRALLYYSRTNEVKSSEINMGKQLQGIIAVLKSVLPTTIVIISEIEAGCEIWGDVNQIEQIVVNLAMNAKDAMNSRGTMKITLRNEPGLVKTERNVVLTVSDTGTGIDSETQKKIFDPFFTTKKVGEGTGMGLSVVQGIVDSHKGRIEVHSESGKGTRFEIYFPALKTATASDSP